MIGFMLFHNYWSVGRRIYHSVRELFTGWVLTLAYSVRKLLAGGAVAARMA
jgi:hypothetical protein